MSMQPDPDPLDPTDIDRAYAEGWADGWDDSLKPRRFTIRHLVEVAVAVAAIASLLGFAVGKASAAPRPTVQPNGAGMSGAASSPLDDDASRVGPWTGAPPTSGVVPTASGPGGAPPAAGIGEPLTGGRSPEPHLRVLPPPKPVAKPPAARLPGNRVRGIASWYGTSGPGLYAAAGPSLRHGLWRGSQVTVCARVCIRLRLTDWCACRDRVIDLSADAFRRLAPLSRGLLRVTVR